MIKIDIDRVRAETPGTQSVVHLNNAGAGLMPAPVLTAMIDHLQLEADIGGYEAAAEARDKIDRTYSAAAELINANPAEIAVLENATVAWNSAFLSIPFLPGDRILTSHAAYVSNYLMLLRAMEQKGVVVELVPRTVDGQIDIDHLRDMMDERVKLVELTHVPTNGGLVNPASEVGEIVGEWGGFYLLDGCQSVGQMPIDVKAIGCDFLSTTGRKWLRGPRGIGFLYVNEKRLPDLVPPFIDLHSARWAEEATYQWRDDARRFENWEFNYAAQIGLGAAVDYTLEIGIDPIWDRVQQLAGEFRQKLSRIPGVTVHDVGIVRGGIVTFTLDGVEPVVVMEALARHNINVNTTDVTSTRLDMEDRGLKALVRASPHYYNTVDEIDRAVDVILNL